MVDEWMQQRVIKMHEEEDMSESVIVELTGLEPEQIEGILGEYYAQDFNQKQKDIGLVSRT